MAPLMAGPSSGAGDTSGGPAPVDQASVSRQDRFSARSLSGAPGRETAAGARRAMTRAMTRAMDRWAG
ncbi:MAG: hypothetical protein AVDCRST_MAG02-1983 [uncultured Rubrobacteraceae bacterium]|uniref:Uncharacterized protein n=1 Tax=uncultured Rubrobacteraceae bacterium TaxID=349277 RepID=A0A6J4R2D4_9ACTN|nr:MAG: hypothetical protein AVDCRST_MAG02-1983 [uncultured Rubrobacteraceae bacterium]